MTEEYSSTEILYILGGKLDYKSALSETDNNDKNLKHEQEVLQSVFSFADKEWSTAPSMLCKNRRSFAAASIGRKIYVAGGISGYNKIERSFECFDTQTGQWSKLEPMFYKRKDCAMAVLNGEIYVTGGTNNFKSLNYSRVEKYSFDTQEWREIQPMRVCRSGHELVELNGFLYAIGGSRDEEHRSVERYDPRTNKWTFVAETKGLYSGFCSCVLENKIYIAANGMMEVYHPEVNLWTMLRGPGMLATNGFKMIVLDRRVFLMGGSDQTGNVFSDVLEYIVDKNEWKIPADFPSLDVPRAYHCLVKVFRDI